MGNDMLFVQGFILGILVSFIVFAVIMVMKFYDMMKTFTLMIIFEDTKFKNE